MGSSLFSKRNYYKTGIKNAKCFNLIGNTIRRKPCVIIRKLMS
ncbi:hypothetical protein IMSAGC013_02899 [Lachnospiraceae bacterium]|nr:hypothetical protein IMSAGC013_02899 [Lachnospiraceae bacterium]